MLTTGFIFITLTLIILVIILFKMDMPRASLPLGIIYIIFIIYQIPEKNKKTIQEIPEELINTNNSEILNKNQKKEKLKPLNKKTEQKRPIPKPETKKKSTLPESKISIKKDSKKNKNQKQIEKNQTASTLKLMDIKICKFIKKRTPVGSDIIFSNSVDSLYCYTRIQNKGTKKEVKHIWYYEGNMMTQVRYNVKRSNIYRSWTRKTIYPHQIGRWRVDVHDNNGTVIGSINFEIKKSYN